MPLGLTAFSLPSTTYSWNPSLKNLPRFSAPNSFLRFDSFSVNSSVGGPSFAGSQSSRNLPSVLCSSQMIDGPPPLARWAIVFISQPSCVQPHDQVLRNQS